jgi:hypothetical protein
MLWGLRGYGVRQQQNWEIEVLTDIIKAIATDKRRFMPPESVPVSAPALLVRSTSASAVSIAACVLGSRSSMPLSPAKSRTCSNTVRSFHSRSCCGHTPMISRTLSISRNTLWPKMVASPASGANIPNG